jgi:hypothetical protein
MKPRRTLITIIGTAALAAGTAGAVAATTDHKKAETAVLADAAKRLDTTPEKLRAALAAAEDAQLDAAVKAGTLTQAQADEIKAHRKAEGTVLGHIGRGPGGPGGRGGHHGGPGGRGGLDGAAAAKALGLTESQLRTQLQTKSLAAIAKAQGKDLADVKAAVKAALTKRLDADVKAGRITDAQRDEMLSGFSEHFDEEATEVHARGDHGRGGPDGPGKTAPKATPTPASSSSDDA